MSPGESSIENGKKHLADSPDLCQSDHSHIDLPPPPDHEITIEFPFSNSQAFDFAIREARKHVTFAKFGDGKKAVYRVTYGKSQIPLIIDLIEYLKGHRLRTVYFDGEKVPWKSVFQFVWCLEMKKRSLRPQYYCYGYDHKERHVNFLGCIHSGIYLSPYAPWHCWGRFTDETGTWRFDKTRLWEEIQRGLHPYCFCPELDLELIRDIFAAFPGKVNPISDKNWQFVEKSGTSLAMKTPGANKSIAVRKCGVSPKGLGFLKEMGKHLTHTLPWVASETWT